MIYRKYCEFSIVLEVQVYKLVFLLGIRLGRVKKTLFQAFDFI